MSFSASQPVTYCLFCPANLSSHFNMFFLFSRPCSQLSPWVPLQQMELCQVSGRLRGCIRMYTWVIKRCRTVTLNVIVSHSRWFLLHDLSIAGAWVWWSCWDLLLSRNHLCWCYVYSWLHWNSAGKSPELSNIQHVYFVACCLSLQAQFSYHPNVLFNPLFRNSDINNYYKVEMIVHSVSHLIACVSI